MHNVKCFYCNKYFDRDSEPTVAVKGRRYAHEKCYNTEQINNSENNKEVLEEYIKDLFGYEEIPQAVNKQLENFIKYKNFTYPGILRTLQYCYEVKHLSKEKSGGRIGIVEYAYNDAQKYFLSLEQMKNTNKELAQQEFIIPTEEVHIEPPKRKSGLRKLFNFLEG